MNQVIVTGASGLIGSQIVKTLLEKNVRVVAAARRPDPRTSEELGVALERLDVLDPDSTTLTDVSASCLIHCATANDIVSKDARSGLELTVNGTWNVLELARRLSVPRVIFFSTFQVYGTELSGAIDENVPPKCETPYGLNHWFGEEVCRMVCAKRALDVAVVRPSNVYGAPAASSVNRETLVPTCFVRAALTSGEIVLHSSGRQLRNFVSTREVADACAHMLTDFPSGFQIYNVCSAYAATVREIAELTAEVHREIFDRPLPVRSLSDSPTVTNRFEARSRLENLWNAPEHSRAAMRREIGMLFDQLARIPISASPGETKKGDLTDERHSRLLRRAS